MSETARHSRGYWSPWTTIIATIITLLVLIAAGLVAFAYSGGYGIGADNPHSGPVRWYIQTLRDRSVTRQAENVQAITGLHSPARVTAGAGLYAGMCTGCHLAPGMKKTELSQGLSPQAPDLAKGTDLTPEQEFWVIKHGIKFTAMPAWGKTHNDQLIRDMVAFLQTLPSLSPAQYKAVVASAPKDHDEMMKN